MGVTDPRKLIVILQDLESELERWAMVASDMLQTASHTQNLTREQVEETRRYARLATEQFYEDKAVYNSKKQNVDDLLLLCKDAVESGSILLTEVETKRAQVQKILQYWEGELNQALAWLKRAELRVQKAEAELQAARRQLQNAESALRSAQAELDRCRNTVYEDKDSQGQVIRRRRPDCSSLVNAVQQAQSLVNEAEGRVRVAQIELTAAQAEMGRATARVKACREAVDLSTKALNVAHQSHATASQALSHAERAQDHARAAEKAILEAGQLVEEEQITVDEMNVQMQRSEDHLMEAQNKFFESSHKEESAQRYRVLARSELDNSIDLLYALNRPELLGGVLAAGIGGVGGFLQNQNTKASGGQAAAFRQEQPVDPLKGIPWIEVDAVVSLNDLPDPAEYQDVEKQKRLPREILENHLRHLREMLPLIENGIGLAIPYWEKRDEEVGNTDDRGYAAAYRAYYGEQPVKVALLDDGTYYLVAGQERIWIAKQIGMDRLPIKLMKRPEHGNNLIWQDESGTEWEVRLYEDASRMMLRIFNRTLRLKIPDAVTDGDGICLDMSLHEDGMAVTRFERTPALNQRAFDVKVLEYAEKIALEKGTQNIFFSLDASELAQRETRDWYQKLGYDINRQGSNAIIYKRLS